MMLKNEQKSLQSEWKANYQQIMNNYEPAMSAEICRWLNISMQIKAAIHVAIRVYYTLCSYMTAPITVG